MANKVFANGREISCKAASGKSAAAFPDVCLSPPPPPAGPVPEPYPNTAFASDTSNGTKTVQISGQEVMIKDTSYFSTSTGDEAATNALGMGVLTGVIQGKAYFVSWSMDVKLEGENAVRHLDLMTHNHASMPGNTPPWTYADRAAMAAGCDECQEEVEKADKACDPWKDKAKCPSRKGIDKAEKKRAAAKKAYEEAKKKGGVAAARAEAKYEKAKEDREKSFETYAEAVAQSECHTALRCFLAPYQPSRCCKPGQTGHHLVEASSFFESGRYQNQGAKPLPGCKKYQTDDAPCVCAEGPSQFIATHGLMHTFQGNAAAKAMKRGGSDRVTYAQAKKQGAKALKKVFVESGCAQKCVVAQLDQYHRKVGIQDDTKVKGVVTGACSDQDVKTAAAKIASRNVTAGGCPI